jgi:hypothetical protein
MATYRTQMQERLGRPFKKDEFVHHIDGDRSNNDEHNLAIMTRQAHGRLHTRERKLSQRWEPKPPPRITGEQVKTARMLLRMTQAALAERAGLGILVIKRFERGSDPRASTVNAIERALVEAGVTLIDDRAASPAGAGAGVRLTARAEGSAP